MKKPDTPLQALWRYRGVLLVASIPVLLVIGVLALVPRKSPLHYDEQHSLKQLQNHSEGMQYSIVFDAGSTGSRIHVFKFKAARSGPELISDTFEQLKPGLSSFADEPHKAADSLKPLLETALKTVPKHLQASTSLSLKATAGLRLLPGDKADKILEAVTSLLKTHPFKMADDAVSIMGGQEEGAFAWLTLNYLLQKLGKGPETTVSAIDLGGGSVQEAFALSEKDAAEAMDGYIVKLKGAGSTYSVYVHSYLGYGLMAGRAKVMSAVASASTHPCFSKGNGSFEYQYAGKSYKVELSTGAADSKECMKASSGSMNISSPCGAEVGSCSFGGAWRGKKKTARPYYVSSYFWDRALDSGIIEDPKAIVWETMPKEFQKKAGDACAKEDAASLMAAYKGLKSDAAAFFCLDLSFCHELLTAGFKLPSTEKITLVKQIEYKGQKIEASWALGAAINVL